MNYKKINFKTYSKWCIKATYNHDFEYLDHGSIGEGIYSIKNKKALILENNEILLYKVEKINMYKMLAKEEKKFDLNNYKNAISEFVGIEKGYIEYVLSNCYDLSDCGTINIYNDFEN